MPLERWPFVVRRVGDSTTMAERVGGLISPQARPGPAERTFGEPSFRLDQTPASPYNQVACLRGCWSTACKRWLCSSLRIRLNPGRDYFCWKHANLL